MKVEEIVLPQLARYYISKRVLEDIEINLGLADVRFNENKTQIHLYSNNAVEIMRGLILISRKAEKTTIGNKYVYEYELDMNIHNGCIFIMKIEGVEYKCRLLHVGYTDKNDKIHSIFHIVKK